MTEHGHPQGGPGHEHYEELVAGYALDALEPREEGELTGHLAACSSCRELLEELRGVAAEIAYAAPPAEPPPGLLASIREGMQRMEAATGSPAGDRAPAAPGSAAAGGSVGEPAGTSAGESVAPRGPRLLDRPRRPPGPGRRPAGRPGPRAAPGRPAPRRVHLEISLRRLAAAVAALVVVGVGVSALRVEQTAQARAAALARYQQVVSQLDSPGARVVSLGREGAASGTAILNGSRVFLVVDNLGRNDVRDSIYVLWAQRRNGTMAAVTGFDVTTNGITIVDARLPASVHHPIGFAVSHEAGRAIPASPSAAVLGPGTVQS